MSDRLLQEIFARTILNDPKYSDPKRLNRHEAQVYSQNGEDGVISEIFSRIGTTTKTFVEIGAGNGLENNTAYPLMRGWSGHWFEADPNHIEFLTRTFGHDKRVVIDREFFTRENAREVLLKHGVPTEFDLLSLDVDQNTSWVWRGLKDFRPRVVVIEYNASIPPQDEWEVPYNPRASWDGTLRFGASLKALERIGDAIGYSLVGCEIAGVNAFFVRNDLVKRRFSKPFTAEHHYEPPRYFLLREWGHPRRVIR